MSDSFGIQSVELSGGNKSDFDFCVMRIVGNFYHQVNAFFDLIPKNLTDVEIFWLSVNYYSYFYDLVIWMYEPTQ